MGRGRLHRGPYGLGDDGEVVGGLIHAAQVRVNARVEWLASDPRVRAAAIVASTFHLDPVALLADPSSLNREVRIAAHNVVQNEANSRA